MQTIIETVSPLFWHAACNDQGIKFKLQASRFGVCVASEHGGHCCTYSIHSEQSVLDRNSVRCGGGVLVRTWKSVRSQSVWIIVSATSESTVPLILLSSSISRNNQRSCPPSRYFWAMREFTSLWCESPSHHLFPPIKIAPSKFHRSLIPLVKRLRLVKGTFPLKRFFKSSKLSEILFFVTLKLA